MQAVSALIGIDFLTGEVLKLIFKNDENIKDPIFACEQSKIKCEIELPQYYYTIIPNNDAKELHKNLTKK